MTRLLFFGDGAATGFGTVTYEIGRRLVAAGIDVRFITTNHTATPLPAPLAERAWAADRGLDVAKVLTSGFGDGWRPEAALVIGDVISVRSGLIGTDEDMALALRDLPAYHYVPIEGTGLPPSWRFLWQVVTPVAMTEFGASQIEAITGIRPAVIGHGVDTAVFHPITARTPGIWNGMKVTTRRQAQALVGVDPNRVIALRTDRHMPRKRYNALLRSFVRVWEQAPNVDLVIHCRPNDNGGSLTDQMSKLRPEDADRVKFTFAHDTYEGLGRDELNVLYNAADLYVSSGSEGFGLCIAEAAATGLPIVGLDYAATPEVAGPAGMLVPIAGESDNEYDHFWADPDEEAFAAAVIELAAHPARRRMLGNAGPAHIASRYSWDAAARAFADLVDAETRGNPRKPAESGTDRAVAA